MAKGQRKVVVRITSDVNGLKKGIFEADLTLKNFAKTSRAAANVAGKALATGASAAAAGLAAIYAQTAPVIAQLRELSQASDTSAKEFQRQAYAVQTVGIEHEKYADILKDVKDRVGDFIQTGGGPMADFFENIAPKVGVTAEQFRNLSGPQALQLFVSSLEKANLSQAEMTFYMEAMASDSTRLLPLLREGGKEMKRLGDEAERTGFVLSEIDAQKVKETDDALKEAHATLDGITRRITVQLAPAIGLIAEKFTDAASETEGFRDETKSAFDFIIEGAALAANAVRGIEIIWKGLGLVAHGVVLAMVSGIEGMVIPVDNVLSFMNARINDTIRLSNKLLGTDFSLLDEDPLAGLTDGLAGTRESLVAEVETIKSELHEILMQPLPGDELKERLAEAYRKADEAARAALAEGGVTSGESGGMDAPLTKQQQEEMEAFRQSLLTKEEVEMEHYERRLEMFAEYGKTLFETEEERKAALEQIEREHQEALTQIANEGNDERARVAAMSWDQQAKFAADTFVQLTAGAAQHNRKMFEINKAAGIAQTTIATYEAATSAYKALAGIPIIGPALGAAAAATAIAAGMANVRAIQSASFGGGGVPSQAPTPPVPVHETGAGARTGGAGDGARGMATINLHGSNFSREAVMQLGEQMNELARDGFEFRFAKG